MQKYRELVVGSFNSPGLLLNEEELNSKVISIIESNKKLDAKVEYFTSLFYYDETAFEHINNSSRLKNYNGSIGVDDLVFDIDIANNTDKYVQKKAIDFVNMLIHNWDLSDKEIEIWYSGRGYHIYLNDYFKFGFGDILSTVKNTIKEHFIDIDCSIYSSNRIFRGKYSFNSKSGRYKIPLTYDELTKLSAEQIIKLAENADKEVEFIRYEFEKDFSKYKVKGNVDLKLNITEEPTRIVTCMQKLYLRGQQVGRRNQDILRLASAWRRQGLHKQTVTDILVRWADTLEPEQVIKVVDRVYNAGYRYGCNDHIMAEFCDPKCIYFTHKNYDSKVISGKDVITEVKSYLDFISNSKYVSLKNAFDLDYDVNIYCGENLVIFGDTKLGKSTVVSNVVLRNKHLKWLILPLENGIPLEVKRLVQIENGLSEQQAINCIKNGERLEFLSSFNFYDKIMTIEDLRKFILDSDADAVVIDTIDQISVNRSDYTSKTEYLANELRELTNSLKRIFILVHHISKYSVEDSNNKRKDLSIHSGKGSSSIEQKANYVISIEGDRESEYRVIKAQGGRDKELFAITTVYDKVTKRIERIKL